MEDKVCVTMYIITIGGGITHLNHNSGIKRESECGVITANLPFMTYGNAANALLTTDQ